MSRKTARWIKALRIGALAVGLVLLALIGGSAYAYSRYFAPRAANLPCRQCSGEARRVTVDGFDLYYRELGAGHTARPPVVVVHGGPGMSSEAFKGAFDFLAGTYRVIYYDQRGSGNSQIRPELEHYTIGALVEELEALRRDVIGADKLILIGHSAGGALVQRYALDYPQHVERMALVASLPANGGFQTSGPWMKLLLADLNAVAGNLPPADPEAANAWFARASSASAAQRLYDPTRRDLVEDMGYVSFATNREVTLSTMGGDFDPALRGLAVETLLLYGAADGDATGAAGMGHLHDLLPHSTLVRFDASGHWLYLEEPEKFRQVLGEFLGLSR